ncbi:hypothetical protein LEP1GSC192_3579 [Leptospira sp. B5-022]|nr:hypothetical protein LEP1GSC192_3579 [Leptospira sp. B5-022]
MQGGGDLHFLSELLQAISSPLCGFARQTAAVMRRALVRACPDERLCANP